MSENKPYAFDWLLFALVLALSGLGLVMLLSSSFFMAEKDFGNGYYFFFLQVRHMLIGLAVMLILARIPYQFWLKWVYPILLISIILLLLAHVPGVGDVTGKVKRWIYIGGFSFQPSEAAKLAVVFYMAYSMSRKGEKVGSFTYGFMPHLMVLGVVTALILWGRDLGTAACVVAIAFIMMFVAGTKIWHMAALGLAALGVLYWQIAFYGFRMARIKSYLDPWSDPSASGYQIIHSFYAFAGGGLLGQGPGASQQKLFFLPEAHTDFILSVAAEELGLIGVAVIAVLFLVFIYRGLAVSRSAKDYFGIYLALGCTLIIGLSAFFNMCVVTGLLPNKGLPLPFFSYGGSNILVCYAAVGLLLNVAGQTRGERPRAFRKESPRRFFKSQAAQAA